MNHCDRPSHKHGKDRQGYQRYKCPVCGKTYSDNPKPRQAGRKPINEQRMTDAERKRRSRKLIRRYLTLVQLQSASELTKRIAQEMERDRHP